MVAHSEIIKKLHFAIVELLMKVQWMIFRMERESLRNVRILIFVLLYSLINFEGTYWES